MRILVTGRAGFIGSNLVRHLSTVPPSPFECLNTCPPIWALILSSQQHRIKSSTQLALFQGT
jgi:hypothetical protein